MIRALPIDPLSIVAIAIAVFSVAHGRLRRWRQRAHLGRLFRSVADVGRNERGAR